MRGAFVVLGLGPQAHTFAGGGASGAAGALIGAGLGDFFNEQGVDAAMRIVTGNARESAVDDEAHAVDGDGGLGDIRGDDDLGLVVAGDGGVLIARGKFAVERQQDVAAGLGGVADGFDGLADLESAGHEDQHVAGVALPGVTREDLGGEFPRRRRIGALPTRKVFNMDGIGASLGGEDGARPQVVFQRARIERRGHHNDEQVGAKLLLNVERAGERDVAVEVALMEFIKDERLHTAQPGVLNELAQQDAFGLELDARGVAGDILKAHLVADFAAKGHAKFVRDARREQPRGEPARLEDDDLSIAKEAVLEEHLRDLRGLAGAGGGLKDEALRRLEGGDDVLLDFVDGQPCGHGRTFLRKAGADGEAKVCAPLKIQSGVDKQRVLRHDCEVH